MKIQTDSGKLLPFEPKKAQIHYNSVKTNRDIMVKARQLGFTTFEKLGDLEECLTTTDSSCYTSADTIPHVEEIFSKVTTAWEYLPEAVKTLYRKKNLSKSSIELEGTRCKIGVGTSARSGTKRRLHISEFAFMDQKKANEVIVGSIPAVPKDGRIFIEFTANGENQAKEFWDDSIKGITGFKPHFYGWFWDDKYSLSSPKDEKEWKYQYKLYAREYNLISDMQEKYNLTNDQFFWYFSQIGILKEKIKQEYPTTADEAFLISGYNVFDLFKLAQQVPMIPQWNLDYLYEGIEVFEKPITGRKYILAEDTAEGVEGDSSALSILDTKTLNYVCQFKSNTIKPFAFAELGVKLAELYNHAFIITERNGPGLSTTNKTYEIYRNVYINQTLDKRTNKKKNEIGFRTMDSNRDYMIDLFVDSWEEGQLGIYWRLALEEMKHFVRKPNGKREHETKYHDDIIFSMILCLIGLRYHREFVMKSNY